MKPVFVICLAALVISPVLGYTHAMLTDSELSATNRITAAAWNSAPAETIGAPTAYSTWHFRTLLTANGGGTYFTDYPVKVTFNSAALIAAARMKSDCGDLRFTNATGTVGLPYYLESGCGTTTTVAWIRVPVLYAAVDRTYQLVHGNFMASSASNAGAVGTVPPATVRSATLSSITQFTLSNPTLGVRDATSTLFVDLFNTNPNTNGQWSIYRRAGDTFNEASWSGSSTFVTRAAGDRAAVMSASHALTANRWAATFTYIIGGGSGADGMTFMFYKNSPGFGSCQVSGGGDLGFSTICGAVTGYGIELDTYTGGDHGTPHVALSSGSVATELGWAASSNIRTNSIHQATVVYDLGRVLVYIDGALLMNVLIASPNTSYTGVGFTAGTGGLVDNHEVLDFGLYALGAT